MATSTKDGKENKNNDKIGLSYVTKENCFWLHLFCRMYIYIWCVYIVPEQWKWFDKFSVETKKKKISFLIQFNFQLIFEEISFFFHHFYVTLTTFACIFPLIKLLKLSKSIKILFSQFSELIPVNFFFLPHVVARCNFIFAYINSYSHTINVINFVCSLSTFYMTPSSLCKKTYF